MKYYELINGEVPVKEFISSLPAKHQAKALSTVDLLADFGTHLREPYAKPIKGSRYRGLWELRVKFAGDISRIIYFGDSRKND